MSGLTEALADRLFPQHAGTFGKKAETRRDASPPQRAQSAAAPAPAPAVDYSTGKTGDAAGTAKFWDSLKWDQSQLDKQYGYTPEQIAAEGGGESAITNAPYDNLGNYYALASNFGETPGQGKLGYGMSANQPELTSQYGSLGSQGGLVPVKDKPGYYTLTRQPAGNKSYNLVQAEYKVGQDGKTLDRVSDWQTVKEQSDTQSAQHFARAGIALMTLGAAGAAAGLGGAAAGEGAGVAGGLAEGAGALAPEAGMGIGEIGASELTPALAESAVGSSGYGLSSAGLGYFGPAAGAGGVAPFNTAASNPALIDSALGTPGYGGSSASGAGGGLSSGLSPQQWQQLGKQASKFGDSGDDGGTGGRELTKVDLAALAAMEAQRQHELQIIAQSSKAVKTKGGRGESLARGVRGDNPIDANGAQIAGIQQLTRDLATAKKRLAALKARKGRKS